MKKKKKETLEKTYFLRSAFTNNNVHNHSRLTDEFLLVDKKEEKKKDASVSRVRRDANIQLYHFSSLNEK